MADKWTTTLTLKSLYALESRAVKLNTETEYIEMHTSRIIEDGGGVWNDEIAETYIDILRHSI